MQGNWVDLVFLLLIVYFVLTNNGFIDTFFEGMGFLVSLFVSYKLYALFGNLLIVNFTFPKGIAEAAGFFIAWFLAEAFFYLIIGTVLIPHLKKLEEHPVNISLGFLAAAFQASLLFLFVVSLIFAFPVQGQIKNDILNSRTGPFFVNLSQSFEKQITNIFGGAIDETLNFLTVKPDSSEIVNLGFKLKESQVSVDPQSEQVMFDLINKERTQRGIPPLTASIELKDLARNYGTQIFATGVFSHVSGSGRIDARRSC